MSKKLPYEVTDIDALQAQYPGLVTEETVVVKTIDHAKLYQVVKVKVLVNEPLPAGVVLKEAKKESAPPPDDRQLDVERYIAEQR